jgi:DNA topoisomerase-6 subunit A
MQTLLVGSGCKQLIEQGKTTSLRGLYYMLKHTIEGTKEETFEDQTESDTIIEDTEVALEAMREELHLYAKSHGSMVGPITLVDSGDEIDCSRMGSGGYTIPSIVEPEIVQVKRCDAKFILHVEKDTVWRRFNEDKFWIEHNCILTHGGGQPPRGVRRLLQRLHVEHKLPVYCLLDNDPWGYYIYSVLKQGSINLAYESKRMAIPEARYIGLRSNDFMRCQLSPSVQIKLNDQDIKRAKQIAQYPWFAHKKPWQKEIELMIKNGFKLEVEALISKEISYVTEEYVPMRLEEGNFLD